MSDTPATFPPRKKHPLRKVLHFFTSLKLCVVILILCAFGVFLGTLAQAHEGLYLAQERWFKSWWVWRRPDDVWWVLTYPGGYLLGVLLIINLTGAHLRRFKYPPGGLWAMLLHYVVVMGALWGITRYLLWEPMYFFLSCTLFMTMDAVLCTPLLGFAHLQATGRKIGVDLVHFGIVVLLVGQLATDMFATETQMSFKEGQTMSYSEKKSDVELVLTQDIQGNDTEEQVTAIPQEIMAKNDVATGEELKPASLPFTVKVKSWEPNSALVDLEAAGKREAALRQAMATLEVRYAAPENLVTEITQAMETPGRLGVWRKALTDSGVTPGDNLVTTVEQVAKDPVKSAAFLKNLRTGFRGEMMAAFKKGNPEARFAAENVERDPDGSHPLPPQAGGEAAAIHRVVPLAATRDMDSRNIPSSVVELTGTAKSLGTWLVQPGIPPQSFEYGGKTWRVALRQERVYHPFSITLLKATHDVYPGTDIPKDYRSSLRLTYPEKKEQRETEVYMNAPLRYEGLTFFQYQMVKDELDRNPGYSALQVVKNPSWFSPYFGCALVGYGMLRHFMLHLLRFLRKRKNS